MGKYKFHFWHLREALVLDREGADVSSARGEIVGLHFCLPGNKFTQGDRVDCDTIEDHSSRPCNNSYVQVSNH